MSKSHEQFDELAEFTYACHVRMTVVLSKGDAGESVINEFRELMGSPMLE